MSAEVSRRDVSVVGEDSSVATPGTPAAGAIEAEAPGEALRQLEARIHALHKGLLDAQFETGNFYTVRTEAGEEHMARRPGWPVQMRMRNEPDGSMLIDVAQIDPLAYPELVALQEERERLRALPAGRTPK